MTTIKSICVKCKHLCAYTDSVCIPTGGERSLISSCTYGGKNAGNRKTCRSFEAAPEATIRERIKALEIKNDKRD